MPLPRSKAVSPRTGKPLAASTAKQRMLRQLVCSDECEQALRLKGYRLIAGVDEVGRGALYGPVVAAAVILPEQCAELAAAGLTDSKQLAREDRERLDLQVRAMALAVCVAEVAAETIDRINIYQASRLAMLNAVAGLGIAPDHLLIDAMRIDHPCAQTRLVYGDSLSLSIAAASVVAKVHRDALMCAADEVHPGYGLSSHKGYATPAHKRALKELGPTPLHRRSFAPVAGAGPDTVVETGSLPFDEEALNESASGENTAWA
ncbi:ribonuclease HII [Terriglobus tenax]|uniref:ribonuclease HII n=1 Tax=Terriglobus tenax TaxID=1111115 RepID=UPI0021E08A72|nr:ribonuclease HII [Terriglobus tenax]